MDAVDEGAGYGLGAFPFRADRFAHRRLVRLRDHLDDLGFGFDISHLVSPGGPRHRGEEVDDGAET